MQDVNYAIFRSEPIYTIPDLAQIGSHNKREKSAYNSNPDIKIELSQDNIEIVPLAEKYVKGFYNITKEYRKEHEEKMKTTRSARRRTFNQMLNSSKNVVADELLFTATHEFFDNMTREDIKEWANTCMDFVYEDLGYTKDQVLHSVIHMDEKTPHIHCVVVPLVRKYDNRAKREKYTISKKQYIHDKIHLSELQDKYHKRLTEKGYDLERGIKGSGAKHQKLRDIKRKANTLEKKVISVNNSIDNAMSEFEEKMKNTKETMFDKEYVKVKKDTFDSMKKVIKEAKKAISLKPKIEEFFEEVNNFTKSHKLLEKENKNINIELKRAKTRNRNLVEENNNLKHRIKEILNVIKSFFRKLLQFGNEIVKEEIKDEIIDYYNDDKFNKIDVFDIAKDTTKQEELFEYVGINKDEEIVYTYKDNYDFDYDDDYDLTL